MTEDNQPEGAQLKPFYVYELVDSDRQEVFYVGMGVGRRGHQHELDADSSEANTEKLEHIRNIKASGGSVDPGAARSRCNGPA